MVLSLIRKLATCNTTTRNRSLRRLLDSWLPSQASIADEDMRKLWKGLFYCVWHSDKLPVQADLVDRLSAAIPNLTLPLAAQYFSVFLLTMRREWTGIDRLRLDKFYLMIRRFLHSVFVLLKNNSWDLEITHKFIHILGDGTFHANDKFQGNGVNYHVASVFVEELRPFLPLRKEVVEVLLKPFVSVFEKVPDKVLLGKIRSNVFDEFLKMGRQLMEARKSGADVESGSDILVLGSIGLVMGFWNRFFELGSSKDCCQGNRKLLFALHEEFLKLEKDLSASGIDILIPDSEVDKKEEPSNVIVEVDSSENGVNGSLKKCKKEKKAADGDGKKAKKKKKQKENENGEKKKKKKKTKDLVSISNAEDVVSNKDNETENATDEDENLITLDEKAMSNLQMQFDKVAGEMELDNNVESACDLPETPVNGFVSKKRKRTKSANGEKTGEGGVETASKSAKKVRFSMKNNIVWKPQSPMPPQSLRLPPSVTPRGSALKKGVPPGPIRELPPVIAHKKAKRANAVKRARRMIKNNVGPGVRRKKILSLTA
ncbi:uncharacterized protein [Rutidosis leptorrhynchoides]|uniref:uncharacterized protein n=1 Tax=Rutidosis leptorrhynchoides TaxID=125765 RepID=UPI003A99B146